MRIKVTRDSVIDKLNPMERSPKHKKLPASLRTKTPQQSRRADAISPRNRKDSFVSPKRNKLVPKKKSKVRAVNLSKLFDETNKVFKKESRSIPSAPSSSKHDNIPDMEPEEPLQPDHELLLPESEQPILIPDPEQPVVSLVSMKTGPSHELETPPPVRIKQRWKKHLPPWRVGYKLFTPDSPAKAAASPHNLAMKLCLFGRISSEPRPSPLSDRLVLVKIKLAQNKIIR